MQASEAARLAASAALAASGAESAGEKAAALMTVYRPVLEAAEADGSMVEAAVTLTQSAALLAAVLVAAMAAGSGTDRREIVRLALDTLGVPSDV